MRPARCAVASATVALGVLLGGCVDRPVPLELAGPPAGLAIESGDAQTGRAGDPLPAEIVVRVTDAAGRPVPGVVVEWTALRGAPSQPADTTDDAGRAAVVWTLPAETGRDSVTAEVEGLGLVRFGALASPVAGDLVFRYLDAGSYHACGLTTTEEMVCWGYNADGQLGLVPSAVKPFPTLVPSPTPDTRFRTVSGGRHHTCALTLGGAAECWGDDRDGRASPPTEPTFRMLQAGRLHTCGLTLANRGLCWGTDDDGQRTGSGDLGYGWAAITAGGLHSCAVATNGAATCWGVNQQGQLGTGAATATEPPTAVTGGHVYRTDPTVVPPAPDPDFPLPAGPYVAAGFAHTCAIANTGTLCWGSNQEGQLGIGSRTASFVPAAVPGGAAFVRLTAGDRHTCGLTAEGAAWCWGDNTFGQLGDGTTDDRLEPAPVAGGLVFAWIRAGELSTCGVTTDGVAYCWGDNEYGQLGDGTTTGASAPVKVAFQR